MSTRSSPLSGLSPSPPIRPTDPSKQSPSKQQSHPGPSSGPGSRGAAEAGPSHSPLSSGSSLSSADEEELELPPSSFPDGPPDDAEEEEEDAGEEAAADGRDTRSQTSETVPLASDESDLTEEDEDEEEEGDGDKADIGIDTTVQPPLVKPEPQEGPGANVEEEGSDSGPSPHRIKIKRIVSAPGSAPISRTPSDHTAVPTPAPASRPRKKISPSPSLTPPPSEEARSRPLESQKAKARDSSPRGVKRKSQSISPKVEEVSREQEDQPVEHEEAQGSRNVDVISEHHAAYGSPATGSGTEEAQADEGGIGEKHNEDDQVEGETADDGLHGMLEVGSKGVSADVQPEGEDGEGEGAVEGKPPSAVGDDSVESAEVRDTDVDMDMGVNLEVENGGVEPAGIERPLTPPVAGATPQEADSVANWPTGGDAEKVSEDAAADDSATNEDTQNIPALQTPNLTQAPTHSSHAPPPTQAAMRALLALEVKFAALRDRLYIERMEEAAEEEELVLSGTHPALQMLHKTLSQRRDRLHELASRRHAQAVEELKVVRKAEQDAVWSWWTDERDSTHWAEFEQTWSKRRRLAREKNEIESVRFIKAVPKVGDLRYAKGIDWSSGPSLSRFSMEEANRDLALMERQIQLSRQASPAVFPPLSAYAIPQQPQYLGYPGGQTYAEAVGSTAFEPPRVPSVPPQSRSGHGQHGHRSHHAKTHAPAQVHHVGPNATPVAVYSSAGLMDQFAYPRSATAVGPSLSSSSVISQPQSSQHSQQPRREGRTVPTASTMFGQNTSASNSPVISSFADAPYQRMSEVSKTYPAPYGGSGNSTATATPTGPAVAGKELKQEALDYAGSGASSGAGGSGNATSSGVSGGLGGLYGPRANALPLAFGMGFGMGLGGGGGMGGGISTPGFGTLGSSAGGMRDNTSLSLSANQEQRRATPVSAQANANGGNTPAAGPAASSSSLGGYGYWHSNSPSGSAAAPSAPAAAYASAGLGGLNGTANRPGSGSGHSSANGDPRATASPAAAPAPNGVLGSDKDREKEKDRPRYPGLAEYLSGQSFSGLGRMSGLDAPKATARSPFPPVSNPNPQTAALQRN